MNIQHSIRTITAVFVFQAFAQSSTGKQATKSAVAEKTLTGVISDSMCGARHMTKDKSPAECTRMCVKQGQKYALVVGQKVYTLQGHENDLNKLAGQQLMIKAAVSGDTTRQIAIRERL
jgi:hypothetical protein